MLERDPNHAKVLQQLGWLHHQQSNSFSSQDRAIEYLEKSVAAGKSDRLAMPDGPAHPITSHPPSPLPHWLCLSP